MQAQPTEGIFITNEQARSVNILLAAVQVAQKAGAYSLADAKAVFEAVQSFASKPDEVSEEETKGSLPPDDGSE